MLEGVGLPRAAKRGVTFLQSPTKARQSLIERTAPFLVTGGILLAWEIIVPITGLPELILPVPSAIGEAIVEYRWILLKHTQVTFLESLYGFTLATVIGITLALGIFSWKAFERSIYPLLVVLNTVPKVALAPIFVLWFGFGWTPKILIAFLIAFFPIVISTVVGLTGIDKDMIHLARSMRASPWQTFTKFRLPAALPSIFGGLKVAITLAVIGAVIGEYVAAAEGLGYLQLLASSEFNSPLSFAALVFIALLGVFLFYVVEIVEKLLIRHR